MEVANREAFRCCRLRGLAKRWIVERTFAWISRNRRLARDFERYATTVVAFVRLAMIRIMLRRLAANTSSWI
jgi:transposase